MYLQWTRSVRFRVVCSVAIVGLLFPCSAHAYIDPGSGLLLLQGLLALIGGLVVFLKNPVKWFEEKRKRRQEQKDA